jgi:CheY-like chemotaxis protein
MQPRQAHAVWARLQGIPVPKILVADDNANIQKMVVLAFEERGIQVVSVGNGEAAVRRIPDLNPDLVLADIFMPVRNGYEVCEFVKKDERFSHVPVILLVGAFDPLDEKEARRVGADGVLKKPFVPPDPLIAMVMSALEKNPKVAAEMAKAREVKEVLPVPAPVMMEVPTRAEPKPLPDFPEPSPEEAALVYGFGKGVRALDDEQLEAAGGPKPPVTEKEETENEADFDGASTSSDWRRNAMDFEVPAESVNMPAFADEHLEAADFPSESEYPPRRVRVPEPVEESVSVAQDSVPAPVIAEPAAAEHRTVVSASSESSSSGAAAADKPAHVASLWSKLWGKSHSEPEPVLETLHTPAAEDESKSEPSEVAAPPIAPHWMDALAPSQVNATGGDWLNKLSAPQESSSGASYPAEEPIESREQLSASVEPVEPAQSQPEVHATVEVPAPQALFPVSHAVHEEQAVTESPAPVPQEEPAENWFAPTPSVFDHPHDLVSDSIPVAASQPDQALELDGDASSMPVALRDPNLVESPAVHVTPEPLLVDSEEDSHRPTEYNSRAQDIPALHSYFAPASGDPVVEEPVAAEPSSSAREEMQVPSFDPPVVEDMNEDANERIPTGPPPNREALSSIPFLTPPPDFRASAPETAAPNQGTVDEVVRRVLERLEPQIHDLLSQGVLKPLVENLLQNELAKKDK